MFSHGRALLCWGSPDSASGCSTPGFSFGLLDSHSIAYLPAFGSSLPLASPFEGWTLSCSYKTTSPSRADDPKIFMWLIFQELKLGVYLLRSTTYLRLISAVSSKFIILVSRWKWEGSCVLVLLYICQCSGSFSVTCSGLAAWKALEIQDIVLFLKLGGFGKVWAESVTLSVS